MRSNENHDEHHEPERDVADEPGRRAPPARALDGIEHAAALQPLVDADPVQPPVDSALDELRQQIAGEENDQRAEQRGNVECELIEAALQTVQKFHDALPATGRLRMMLFCPLVQFLVPRLTSNMALRLQ